MTTSNLEFPRMDSGTIESDYTTPLAILGGVPALHDLIYRQALRLVEYIDGSLVLGTHHFRLKSGRLLRTLDEVVSAILKDELVW